MRTNAPNQPSPALDRTETGKKGWLTIRCANRRLDEVQRRPQQIERLHLDPAGVIENAGVEFLACHALDRIAVRIENVNFVPGRQAHVGLREIRQHAWRHHADLLLVSIGHRENDAFEIIIAGDSDGAEWHSTLPHVTTPHTMVTMCDRLMETAAA